MTNLDLKAPTPSPPAAAGRHPADDLPPFRLPGEHFAAGLAWLGLGALALPFVAADLAAGAYLTPRVLAVTHSFTLGWVTTSIFGALYQLFPVTMGAPARSVRLGHRTFWVLQAGIVTLVAGLWRWHPVVLAAGWLLLLTAVGGLAWNLLPQWRRAVRGGRIGGYIAAGLAALGLALLVVGLRIAAALAGWEVDRLGILAAHAHLAAVGFATLTAVGVGSKLLPMFLLSRGHAEWPLRPIGPLVAAGLLGFAVGALAHLEVVSSLGGIAVAAGIGLYLVLVLGYFRHRARARLEPALAHVAAAYLFLTLATLAGLALLATPTHEARLVAAYGVLGLLGWLSLLIVGVYYRIVPFLTWLHRFSPLVGQIGAPKVTDLTIPALAWTTLVLLPLGIATLAAGIGTGKATTATAGASIFALGAILVIAQHARMVTLRSRNEGRILERRR